jgi:hypothetical protein
MQRGLKTREKGRRNGRKRPEAVDKNRLNLSTLETKFFIVTLALAGG